MESEKLRTIIFCQGDKRELEEMTGEKYEYIHPDEINESLHKALRSDLVHTSYIETWTKTRNSRVVKHELYRDLDDLNADALIHYTECQNTETIDACEGVHHIIRGRGTPVRKIS